MKQAKAGSLNSCDVLVWILEANEQKIVIESPVLNYFERDMLETIHEALKTYQLDKVHVKVVDQGALDATLKARLKTAIRRYNHA